MKVNLETYKNAINENLDWLNNQPKTLEREHIKKIISDSIELYYPKQVKNYDSLDNVRLSCLQEVWQAWCESDRTTDFDNWLHDKLHEA